MPIQKSLMVYVISDSVGETAEWVLKAATSQFKSSHVEVERFPYVIDKGTVDEIVISAKETGAMIAFTLVLPEIRDYLKQQCEKAGIHNVDLLGPTLKKLSSLLGEEPTHQPGLIHKLDEDYFRRVEAIEFAVKYDDGRDPRGLPRADVVLIGVSRTSKTPLSQYLAMKRLKVANVPIVPEVEPPEELFSINPEKCFGLRISSQQLNHIRKQRLKSLGLDESANYAKRNRIEKELEHFEMIVSKLGCQVIDVSDRAVEETANLILAKYHQS